MAPKTEHPKTEVAPAKSTEVTPAHPAGEVQLLDGSATLADVIVAVNLLIARATSKRDRGPESKRTMTEDDAKRVMLGDLKDASHTKAAEELGLSYGQVYSARKGFTFKAIYQEMLKAQRAAKH